MKVEITFTEPLLGTLPGNKEIAEEFVISKHPEGSSEDEMQAASDLNDAVINKSTIFTRNKNGNPILWDYQIKGFFKDACSIALRVAKVPELRAYKKIVDGLIFVKPRQIPLNLAGELTFTERPLRGQTAQGERISLARSETAPAGTTIEFEVLLLKSSLEKFVINWLDYGALRGLGQWRNSGMGRFVYKLIE